MTKTCRCECGYTCHMKCGLPRIECAQRHYRKDCDHKWNGEYINIDNGVSVTCSVCGLSAHTHDIFHGP